MVYKTKGVCAQGIEFEIDDNKKVHNIKFTGGCSGPVIRKMLREFPGAVISISHDRKYIEEVCDKIYQLNPNGLQLIGD